MDNMDNSTMAIKNLSNKIAICLFLILFALSITGFETNLLKHLVLLIIKLALVITSIKIIFKTLPKIRISNKSLFSNLQLILLAVAGIYLWIMIVYLLTNLTNSAGYENFYIDYSNSNKLNSILLFFHVGILTPILEDYIFRCFIQENFNKYGKLFSLLVTGILFGLFHGGRFYTTIFAGIIFGIPYMLSGSVLYTNIIHIAANTGVFEYPLNFIANYIFQYKDFNINSHHIETIQISFILFITLFLAFVIISKKQIKDYFKLYPIKLEGFFKSIKEFFSAEVMMSLIFLLLMSAISSLIN